MPVKKDTPTKTKATKANASRSVPGKMSHELARDIMATYATGTTLRAACRAHNVSSVAFQQYRRRHPDIEAEWKEHEELNTDALEQRAHELALEADSRSPTMLIFMLKARRPSMYRDNVSVQGSVTVDFAASFAMAMEKLSRGASH